MIKEKVIICDQKEELYEAFSSFVEKMLDVYPIMNIALSGGSTPLKLFDYWAKNYSKNIDWDKTKFFWGDERCVPTEDEESNFGKAKKHLFSKLHHEKPKIWKRIHGENDPEEEAIWYSNTLDTKLFLKNKTPSFELVILGLGNDGHTLSIFPENIELWDSPQNCVVSQDPKSKTKRISITGKVVNNAQHIAFLVTGANKAAIVKEILENRKENMDKYPAARVYPKFGNLYWFLDKEAASLLDTNKINLKIND